MNARKPTRRNRKRAAPGLQARLQLDKDGMPFLGPARIDLLHAIAREGSISAAARSIGMSYKAAWDAIDAMNNRAEAALVTTAIGGSRGGGAVLTDYGRTVVELVQRLEAQYADALQVLNDPTHELRIYQNLMRRFSMRTSARNQWFGTISRLSLGLVQAEVAIALGASLELVASISSESAHHLALRAGSEVCALVKATAVSLQSDASDATGVNRWPGTVTRVQAEPNHVEITAAVAAGRTVTAIIGSPPSGETSLREHAAVTIAIAPSSVTLVVPF